MPWKYKRCLILIARMTFVTAKVLCKERYSFELASSSPATLL